MLPHNLLRAKISGGKVLPIYAPLDATHLTLSQKIIDTFRRHIGVRKGDTISELKSFEESFDYRLIRGLSTLLERRCTFGVQSRVSPTEARLKVFVEASKTKVVSQEHRRNVLKAAGEDLGVQPADLEKSLYADLDEELILEDFNPLPEDDLLREYNQALTQTQLSKALRMEFHASGNWKNIFRAIRLLGLMYTVEEVDQGYKVSVNGPLSLIRQTDRYGTSMAKLLPELMASPAWQLKAEVLGRNKSRAYDFIIESIEAHDLLGKTESQPQSTYDSGTEERFARSFKSLPTGWALKREPDPLSTDGTVLIPDFSFEKQGVKVYLEIVGFWTQEYLERKLRKLESLAKVDMIVAVDENLACSRFKKLKGRVIFYKRNIPVKPILDHLETRGKEIIGEEVEILNRKDIKLNGEIVSIQGLAKQVGFSTEAVANAVHNISFEGYTRIGDYYVANGTLHELEEELIRLDEKTLSNALSIIERYGFADAPQVLADLGYTVRWESLDSDKAKIQRTKKSTVTTS